MENKNKDLKLDEKKESKMEDIKINEPETDKSFKTLLEKIGSWIKKNTKTLIISGSILLAGLGIALAAGLSGDTYEIPAIPECESPVVPDEPTEEPADPASIK